MNLTGHLIIGAADVGPTAGTMRALDPRTNTDIEPPFAFGAEAEVDRAARLADAAFDSYNATTLAQRAVFLERMLVNVGQACLKPGVIVAVEGAGFEAMRQGLAAQGSAAPARTMLTAGIHQAYLKNLARQQDAGARSIAAGAAPTGQNDGQALLAEVDGDAFLANPVLADEVFGSAALLVRARDVDQLTQIARSFRGQLSAAMHLVDEDHELARGLLPILERRTGRIVINAFAHLQELGNATVHGGAFPATTDSRFTSVGMAAIGRFLRPVTYQNFPDELLPEALKNDNALALWRLVDGELSPKPIQESEHALT